MARNLRKLLVLGLGVGALAGLAVSCQSYELEEVEPKAFGAERDRVEITGKMEVPYIMLVVDTSGSMNEEVSSGSTKWDELLDAFANPSSGFLPQSRELARFGLAHFPASSGSCDSGSIDVALDPGSNNVDVVMSKLDSFEPVGGTPIGPTLDIVRNEQRLANAEPGRMRFLMLLTDGLPNCNASAENVQRCDACNRDHPNDACNDYQSNECYPTNSMDGNCDDGSMGVPKGTDCLDANGTVEAITRFREMGVDTFVIGFGIRQGSSIAAVGNWVLNKAAEAGGRARAGETKYYPASNRIELQAALEEILQQTQQCLFPLDPPPISESVVQVSLYDSTDESETAFQKGSEWTISSDLKSLEVLGDRCTLIQTATPNRYELRINYASEI